MRFLTPRAGGSAVEQGRAGAGAPTTNWRSRARWTWRRGCVSLAIRWERWWGSWGRRRRRRAGTEGAPFASSWYSFTMLDDAHIAEIARQVGREKLSPRWFQDVMVEPAVDSLGNDAVRLTMVIAPSAVKRVKGDDVIGLLVELRKRLDAAGEERVPLIGYATRDELAASIDSEP
jgi:hypothetical protein